MARDIQATIKFAGMLVLIFIVYLFHNLFVQPPVVDPDHPFNTQRAYERLTRILGDEAPHPVDSEENDAVRSRLLSEIETLGFDPLVDDAFHCAQRRGRANCARLKNILFWVTAPGPNAVLVLSHYDSVPAGPGASDDGAGVAASLEIASLLKDRALNRPLAILITDGEEVGLLGAHLFVKTSPLADQIGAVVNMEARGVTGLSALIQTSRPNGRDLKTLQSTTRLPASSSLNADIYELLPNDTDMTEFLPLSIDAANLAYAGGVAFYHTPGDNLANLDKRALFNIGAAGLAATEGFLAQTGDEPESQLLYVDLLGFLVITVPIWLAVVICVIGLGLALFLLWKLRSTTTLWRIGLVPLLALLLGLALAIGATMLVDVFRPERFFGAAYPIALRGLQAAAGLTGAMFVYTFLSRPDERTALVASAWLWIGIISASAMILLPGAAIMTLPALAVFIPAAIALIAGRGILGVALLAAAALMFALIILPLVALGENGLFIEQSAPFTALLILLFTVTIPLVMPPASSHLRALWISWVGTGAVTGGFFVASLLVPAYSVDTPRTLSISHISSDQIETPVWSIFGSDKVPEQLNEVAAFAPGTLPVFGGPRQIAAAPQIAFDISAIVSSDTVTGDIRTLNLTIDAPDIDRISITIGGNTPLLGASINGVTMDSKAELTGILCNGRSCRNLNLVLNLPKDAETGPIDIFGTRFGLGEAGNSLLLARPDWTITRQLGDTRVRHIRLKTAAKTPD